MKRHFFVIVLNVLLLLLNNQRLSAQTNLGGIINTYAAVTSVDKCTNTIIVDDAQSFFVGEKVLLIQMRGAAISTANNATYGDVNDYQSCGNYEINTIAAINGNVITFLYSLVKTYDANGIVQLVSVNEYTSATVNAPVRSQPWNGSVGGIVIFKADTIILNDSISVSGQGFRGGILENDNASQACFNSGNGGASDYFCTTVNCGAKKGEGIGGAHAYGRGKNGGGGGGGNDHNTGGGGGGNYGKGGNGGVRSNTSNFNCPGPSPGVGGVAMMYSNSTNKIFFGGGGGAGDANNNRGSGGANGGGIVLLIADVLVANGKSIKAYGNDVTFVAGSDGAGGGGGGGTVLLSVNSIVGVLKVDVTGGDGGKLDNDGVVSPQAHCMGPGGGGGGGILWVKGNSVPPQINLIDTGGINGRNVFGLAVPACPTGTTNGASHGDSGGIETSLTIPIAANTFIPLTATICCDDTVCPGETFFIESTAAGVGPITFNWSNGATTEVITDVATQTSSYIVSVSDASGCELALTATITVSNNPPDVVACCDTSVCAGNQIALSIVNQGSSTLSYAWNTGETSSAINPTVNFSQSFVVTATDASGCEVVKAMAINVPIVTTSAIANPDTAILPGQQVELFATGDTMFSYEWSPVADLNNASIQSPIALPSSNTTYCVTATALANCSASACVDVEMVIPDVKIPDAFSPNGDGVNDGLEIFPLKYARIYLIRIFNRWGEVVFEARDNKAWDGNFKGKPQPADAYSCVVEYGSPLNSGKKVRLVKDILLVR